MNLVRADRRSFQTVKQVAGFPNLYPPVEKKSMGLGNDQGAT